MKNQYNDNPTRFLKASHKWYMKIRMKVLIHYGGNPPKCADPYHIHLINDPFQYDIQVFAIDHINGGGKQEYGYYGSGQRFYTSLIKRGFPEGYQVLCANCNKKKQYTNHEFRKRQHT